MASAKKIEDAPLVWLVHPGRDEAARSAELEALGYRVVTGPWSSREIIRKKTTPPRSVVIDLSRSPSSGRDIAVAMRSNRELVNVPFVLVEGVADSIAAIKKLLPDGTATTWKNIRGALAKALAKPSSGGKQLSVFAAYEGKSLVDKLGIKTGAVVATVNAPSGLIAMLGALPEGAKFHRGASARDLTLWFVRRTDELATRIVAMKPHAASGRLWIMWRKDGSTLNQNAVRKSALDAGMVDFRISRIDAEWAGMRFTIRK